MLANLLKTVWMTLKVMECSSLMSQCLVNQSHQGVTSLFLIVFPISINKRKIAYIWCEECGWIWQFIYIYIYMAVRVTFLRFKCKKELLIWFYSETIVNLIYSFYFLFLFLNGCPKSGTVQLLRDYPRYKIDKLINKTAN